MKKLFSAGVMLVLLALVAQPAAAAPVYNWTGCYIGGHAGGVWGRTNVDIPLYPSNFNINAASGGDFAERYQVDWTWAATACGRAGFALDNFLIYLTAGGAWVHLRCAKYLPGISESACKTDTHLGWTVGPGVDFGLTPHLIVGIEYLFASFQRRTYNHVGPSRVDLDTHTARARMSWKF